ncbi:MAG: hypothetical protein ABS59_11920 [Methylobacterium sp. SCN 67-24]|nr:MAG: hypothetical protein ABS59_11920 [Methylobacterium sp. SCN 67-24]
MDLTPNRFKEALSAGRKQVGFWLTLASPAATEIAAEAGFDWVLIDMEHSPNDLSDVVHQLRACGRGNAEPVVRVPELNVALVKRLLDVGVRSFMFPNISSVEEARLAVASTRYPPAGIRGVAGTTRASHYGRAANYFTEAAKHICIVVQLEGADALAQAHEIALVPGVDGLFIGPNDLAASLGHIGDVSVPSVQAAVRSGLETIGSSGRAAGFLDFNPASAMSRFDDGFTFIAVGGDGSSLAKQTSALVAAFRSKR